MKIPRDVSADLLIKVLSKFGYQVTRQKGSHIRLTLKLSENEHHITIPNHSPIKIGTLNNIINEVANINRVEKEEIIKLF